MSDQRSFFDPPPRPGPGELCPTCGCYVPVGHDTNAAGGSRRGDPDTSRLAALANMPRSGSQRDRVLRVIVAAGERGATADEVAAATGLPYVSVAPRISELKLGGWVAPSDRTRTTRSSSEAQVIVAAPRALEAVAA